MSAVPVAFPRTIASYTPISGAWAIIGPQLDGMIASGAGLITATPIILTDYILEIPLKMLAANNLEAAIVFRFKDSSNFYWAGLGLYGHFVSIGKYLNGVPAEQAYAKDASGAAMLDTMIVQDQRYILKVIAEGARIRVYINNLLYLDFTDPTSPLLSGIIGFRIYSAHVQFAVDTLPITVKALDPAGLDLGVEVTIDGNFVGYTPNSFPFEAGNHTVMVQTEVTR